MLAPSLNNRMRTAATTGGGEFRLVPGCCGCRPCGCRSRQISRRSSRSSDDDGACKHASHRFLVFVSFLWIQLLQ
jgi:hypothetical protein